VPLLEAVRLLAPSFWLRRVDFLKHFGSLDRKSSAESIHSHYDDGNDLFKAFLDDKMVYTCALFNKSRGAHDATEDLSSAQTKKIDRILELASIPEGGKVLDIGSGWGGLVGRALSQGYVAKGLCNAANMVSYAQARYGAEHFDMLDYRDIPATHDMDAVTSVEMIEAVPCRDYPHFVDACDRALRPGGRVSMQVIHAYAFNNPVALERDPVPLGTFVTTHIFPGQQLPNLEFLHEAFLKSGKFRKIYSEECGMDYARTLLMWGANLERAVTPDKANGGAPALKISRRTLLKYRYYLAWCRAGFSNELLDLARIVFEKKQE
jgi:cyclopropane-fatty-acyl-phospholipid synthase